MYLGSRRASSELIEVNGIGSIQAVTHAPPGGLLEEAMDRVAGMLTVL
jgi:hypothetical protein